MLNRIKAAMNKKFVPVVAKATQTTSKATTAPTASAIAKLDSFSLELSAQTLSALCLIAAARGVDYLTAIEQLVTEAKPALSTEAVTTPTSELIKSIYGEKK
ncbi:MAG: hypothetical protein Q7T66_04780 [Herminiimonas sp.]|uniref:hypothetical protein n=1 Tax=Herminiimonas sp. TaxID=1926289 RepID=UPI00272083BC|nr:hypothetical protein [Herminiimonas sp.]MDO9419960.1 hypothetical protein [Herminiimonas sp.]